MSSLSKLFRGGSFIPRILPTSRRSELELKTLACRLRLIKRINFCASEKDLLS